MGGQKQDERLPKAKPVTQPLTTVKTQTPGLTAPTSKPQLKSVDLDEFLNDDFDPDKFKVPNGE